MYYLVFGLHFLYLIANPTPCEISTIVLYFCANYARSLSYVLIISRLSLYKFRTKKVRNFVLRTKRHFVQKSTIRTVLYENRAVCKYLIYNVINGEK